MEVIVPIGISGSGKSRLYERKYKDKGFKLISSDLVCKEITGDINDYSKEEEVFYEVCRMIGESIEKGESIYYDNCNINSYSRKIVSWWFKESGAKVIYLVFPVDLDLCKKRIEEDLKNGIERANVPEQILLWQFILYMQSLDTKFEGENVQEVIYLKPEELD